MHEENLSQKLDHLTDLLKWLPQEICNVLEERQDVRNDKVFRDLMQSMEMVSKKFSYDPPKELE